MTNTPVTNFSVTCERVKMVDIHPKEPLFIAALYSGVVNLWNYETEALVKSFDTGTGLPVRCARFIPKLNSFICGCDDTQIRVYNYNTMERTAIFPAHDDFIRSIAVHEVLSIVLTCSDDMTVRQWDWKNGWVLETIYEGHEHCCLGVAFNPKDQNTFATCSMDCTIKFWSINNVYPNYQLEGHEDCVNCIEYYPKGDKPYLLSGSDDFTVRLWDYQNRQCLQIFPFHTANVTSVLFHPDEPLIITVAEDTDMKVISSETFRLLFNMDHHMMNRAWTISAKRNTNRFIVGYDNGISVFSVGDGKPVFSMDSNGRIFCTSGNEVIRLDMKAGLGGVEDGEVVPVVAKDLGTAEKTVTSIVHGSNTQFVALLSGSDYTIVSTLSLRPKTYGAGISFVWGPEAGSYAVLESPFTMKLFKSYKEYCTISFNAAAVKLFGGTLLAVKLANCVVFYDWNSLSVIRQIDEAVTHVVWSTSGNLVALATDTTVFLLRFNGEAVAELLSAQPEARVDGVDVAFDLVDQIGEAVTDLFFVGDSIAFINKALRLHYYVGGEIGNVAVLSRGQFLLGYVAKENRILFIDVEKNVTSYAIDINIINYMNLIVKEEYDAAASLVETIPTKQHYKLAKFVQGRGLLPLALQLTTDEDHKFELALTLRLLDVAEGIARGKETPTRLKRVGDLALSLGNIGKAVEYYRLCGDHNSLLLIFSCCPNREEISALGDLCVKEEKYHLAFSCFHLVGRYSDAAAAVAKSGKPAESAFYARTHCPDQVPEAVLKWKESIPMMPRLRDAIADPVKYPNLFASH
ncbi:beta prime cop protein [Angomonas deanei]|uniref:Coatomer subunit beta' n=1 Tax=Angomonas deanei TaxID=59799 RepID=A0A7G2CQH3_9TRYP|nr:beta prime cop protein [Angomonas deanei]CAD2221377.1 WD domain, G-beta repeat/Coatomer WD associated region containing protein, putative [Angomonas deanei]|eukprot:EPY22548.1 beta prime cop protein [Angomonas deanei]